MKKLLILLFTIVSVAGMSFITIDGLNIGDALPKATVKLKDVSGKQITMQEAKKENVNHVPMLSRGCPECPKNLKKKLKSVKINKN